MLHMCRLMQETQRTTSTCLRCGSYFPWSGQCVLGWMKLGGRKWTPLSERWRDSFQQKWVSTVIRSSSNMIPIWQGQWAIKYDFWLSLCEICVCIDSGHCVWVLCWCENQELDAMGREAQGIMEIPQQASLLTFPLKYIFLYSNFHWSPHTHPCAYTHAVPPSTRFWYQQWTHCAMTSWCTTSLWLRDLSCWLDQLGQAKPQWPKECCRSWILQCSTYSPSTSLHRYTVYLCDYVCGCVGRVDVQHIHDRKELLTLTLPKW